MAKQPRFQKPASGLPDSNDFSVLLAATSADIKLREPFGKRLLNAWKPPVDIRLPNVSDFGVAVINAAAKNIKKHFMSAQQAAQTLSVLLDAAIVNAATELGTHTTKHPDTNATVGEPMLVADNNIPVCENLVTSRSVRCRRKNTFSGNAANGRYWRFLAASYTLDGVTQTIAEDFASHGPVFRALSVMDRNRSAAVSVIVSRRLGSSSTAVLTEVPANITTIYWPVGDTSHLISPVSAMGLITEIKTRISEREDWVPTIPMKVGGTKPQNAGLLASDLAGYFPLLRCEPPKRGNTHINLSDEFDRLHLLDEKGRKNANVKDGIKWRVGVIVDAIIDDFFLDPPYGEPKLPTITSVLTVVSQRAGFTLGDYLTELFEQTISGAIASTTERPQ